MAKINRAVLFLALIAGAPAVAEESSGTFAHISDIHFNPFDPPTLARSLAAAEPENWPAQFAGLGGQKMSRYGEDTNHSLLASAVDAIARTAANADFAIVTGDFLVHKFQDLAAKALGAASTPQTVDELAVKTTRFVAEEMRRAFPGKPVFLTLGNNDSSCGDYKLDPGGAYLTETRDTVRALAGDFVATDFDATYLAGGYYAARHPTVANTLILVVNDVLWSAEYQNACGTTGLAPAEAELAWLGDRLKRQKEAGGHVWLAHHIPIGIDPYSTAHSTAATCPAKITPFLKEPFASTYLALLRQYAETITGYFTGHVHFDDYRLIADANGTPVDVDKIAPAISPVFGQNPGFHLFTYDRQSGLPTDFSAIYLANLEQAEAAEAGDWLFEYSFAKTYGQPNYSPQSVEVLWKSLAVAGPVQDTFRRLYNVSRGALSAATFPAYVCAMAHPDPQSFAACYCGG
jgi:sphingomyelin phosphodiesterase acid-like 3